MRCWGSGSAKRWNKPCPAAPNAPKSKLSAKIKRVEMGRDVLEKAVTSNCFTRSSPNRLIYKPLPVNSGLHRTLTGASALTRAGREPSRLLPVTGPYSVHSRSVAGSGAGGLHASRPALRRPPPGGRIMRQGPRGGALCLEQLATPVRTADPEHPLATPPHDGGRPVGHRGRKLAAGPARAHGPESSMGRQHYLPAAERRALVLPDHLA